MFAALVLAARGRPARGVGRRRRSPSPSMSSSPWPREPPCSRWCPTAPLTALVAAMFLAGAVYAYLIRNQESERALDRPDRFGLAGGRPGAAVVIFVAEWGDLTQILTANLAARYHSPLSVAVASLAALWAGRGPGRGQRGRTCCGCCPSGPCGW